ncbi:GlcG/HbpS family heme-binding protein [Billgrantia desiderata]|uniref:Heme-binding protein n=2 Tax=Billgrantia desiderata TaxID=52021 RepID=A0AAW4YUG7_9GAMM|nr:heme-binding protein [Halomonas desiderata]MCE8042016.1 heme-binding protein [Halomonas desiderata]MCE8046839.1 heme-binding protein [Halomonas desiderata]MCE8051882.1 heme-binding protein [Halomonas desiderata]NIC36947.1 heme-binding protein [Halomonas desiderata]
MKTKPVLTLNDVNAILDAAQKEAEANGWAVTIAVADDGGHLLGLRRLDGAAPMTPDVATQKARSAALGRKETQVFEEMINGGRNAFLSAPLSGLLTGGVPVLVDGEVAGTVGVSGVKPDQDVQIAKAGIAAVA